MHEDGGVVLPSGKRPSNRVDRDGYRSIHLGYAGKSCKITLARAICFLCNGEPPSPGYVVDHINGIKTDDRPENLRWATYEENTLNGAANRSTGHTPQRIAACMAACEGIDDPAAVLAEVRAILERIAKYGPSQDAHDARRALALLTPTKDIP